MALKRRTKRLLIAIILLLIIAPGAFALWLYREMRIPVSHTKSNDYIEIPRRSTPEGIVNKLVSEGVLRRKWPLLLYIKLTGSAKLIKAGDYRFPSPITPVGFLQKLEEGEQRLSHFTVIEGWTHWDIADDLAHMPELKLSDSKEALTLMDDTSGIHDLDPQAENLEGYLFPATYSYPLDTKPAAVVAGAGKKKKKKKSPPRGPERTRPPPTPPPHLHIPAFLFKQRRTK